jgi:ADP-ribosylglycohydrolase
MESQHEMRLARARVALEGLSVGDGFGEQFFYLTPDRAASHIEYRAMPLRSWEYTDDTQMALSIYSVLLRFGEIDQERLIQDFARHYEPRRKYGASMRGLFTQIVAGVGWQKAASSLFDGQGSYGNGAAMRAAPLGAYFADDLDMAVENARRSAEVTHSHEEGIAGAIAVTIAAAFAWRLRGESTLLSSSEFIDRVISYVPTSEVRSKLREARDLRPSLGAGIVAAMLGNGSQISAPDTVPFAIWCAIEHLTNFEDALWATTSVGGDMDTNCAIVGGIIACYTGVEGIPQAWRESREALPEWAFME